MNRKVFFTIIAAAFALSGCKKDKDPELGASPASLSFAATEEAKTFNVTSNVDWTISGKPDWLTISDASGKGDKQITVTAAANTGAQREATLTVAAKGAKDVPITVMQAAAEAAASVNPNPTLPGDFGIENL